MSLPVEAIGAVVAIRAVVASGAVVVPAGAAKVIGDAVPTHRQCTIEVINQCSNYTLQNASEHINSGSCSTAFPDTIAPSTSASALYTKTSGTARGSVGVFTYDLIMNNTKESIGKMAVMFSVPYDYNLYSNWYAVGIFDTSKKCDHDLYCQMYNDCDQNFVRRKANEPHVHYEGQHVAISATMSDTYQPVMRVRVTEK